MKKNLLIAISIAILSFGCTSDITGSSGKNKTKLNLENMDNKFTITTTAKNLTDYYHVNHYIVNSSGTKILDEGTNYEGTVITTCTRSVISSSYIDYSCITHWDTKSPVGDQNDERQNIRLYDSSDYNVFLKENSFNNSKTTKIGLIK